jgi:hypothetical protein
MFLRGLLHRLILSFLFFQIAVSKDTQFIRIVAKNEKGRQIQQGVDDAYGDTDGKPHVGQGEQQKQ